MLSITLNKNNFSSLFDFILQFDFKLLYDS